MSIRQTNFNSIKVRLKQGINNAAQSFIAFQFHKGTIKTGDSMPDIKAIGTFQFHKGTIKTSGFRCAALNKLVFQFHKGTIKTPNSSSEISAITPISIP